MNTTKKAFISFFKSYKEMKTKEFFDKWNGVFRIIEFKKFKINYKRKKVNVMEYCFIFCTSDNMVYIYFYKGKPIKAKSCIKGLSGSKVLKLAQEAGVSSFSSKIKVFVLNNNGYDYARKCSNKAIMMKLLGYLNEDEADKLLEASNISHSDWAFVKKGACVGRYPGYQYININFFDKDILKQKIYEYRRSQLKLVR